jgi:hypothetical protein
VIRALAELLVVVGIPAIAVYYGIRYHRLKRLVEGFKDPEHILWLPRRERQAHARELVQRESDEYHQQVFEKATEFIQKGKTHEI